MSEYKIILNDVSDLLNKWNKRLREGQFSHYQAERYYKKYHYFFGVPAIILTMISGSLVFLFDVYLGFDSYGVIIGLSSFLSSILVGIQTFVKFSELSEKHLNAAVKYGSLRREVERIKVMMYESDDSEKLERDVSALKLQIDDLAAGSPNVSKRIWKNAKIIMDKELNR